MTALSRACQVCTRHTYTVHIPALSALVCLDHEAAYLAWAQDHPDRPASEWPQWRSDTPTPDVIAEIEESAA